MDLIIEIVPNEMKQVSRPDYCPLGTKVEKTKKNKKTNLAYLSHLYIISSILAEQSEKKNSWLESSAGVGIAQTVRPTRLRGGGSKKKKVCEGYRISATFEMHQEIEEKEEEKMWVNFQVEEVVKTTASRITYNWQTGNKTRIVSHTRRSSECKERLSIWSNGASVHPSTTTKY